MRIVLPIAIGAAAVAGVAIGSLTATQPRAPEPSVAIAELPTSTPDGRPALPPQTLTPTRSPAPQPATATFPTTIQVTTPPQLAATPAPTPRPTPTPEPRGRPVVFFAAPEKEPAPVAMPGYPGGSQSDKVYYRLGFLRQQKIGGPEGYLNLFATMKARLLEVAVDDPRIVTVGFSAPDGDWGVTADQVRLVLQQIVFTATEEPNIDFVRIRQNGGKPAVIAGTAIDAELTRDSLR